MKRYLGRLLLRAWPALLASSVGTTMNRPVFGQVLTPQQSIVTLTPYYAVSVSSDTVVVGAGSKGSGSAPVYVFIPYNGGWTGQALLRSSDWTENDAFGSSVALSGNTIVVGAASKGAAYVFVRQGTTWTQQGKLLGDGVATSGFGTTIALSGDTALVGRTATASRQGAAYVFVRTGTAWVQQQELVASDGRANDSFGQALSISQDTAAISYVSPSASRGVVDVFTRAGAAWSEQQKLSTTGSTGQNLGSSVGVSGDTLAASDHLEQSAQGKVFVYVRNGSSWSQAATLVASDSATSSWFGYSLSLSGDALLVGARGTLSTAGNVYTFARSGSTWTQTEEFFTSGTLSQGFGPAVALFGNTAAEVGYGALYASAPLQTSMNGLSETPSNSSAASGTCFVALNSATGQVGFSGTFSGLAGAATSASLRGLAGIGATGPTMLASTTLSSAKSGTFAGAGTVSPGQTAGILAGNAYCEVADALFPAGEIRGQVPAAATTPVAVPLLSSRAVSLLMLLLSLSAVLVTRARALGSS